MSKTTKVLASLGVVAALGVSMLPMSSYAAIKYWDGNAGTPDATNIYEADAADGSVAGDIKVKTTIDKVLSITLEGNDDNHAKDTDENASHVVLLSDDNGAIGTAGDITGKITNGSTGQGTAKVTVATNNTKGYTLKIKGATAELVGLLDDASGNAGQKNKIPAATTINGTDSAWAYKAAEKSGAANNGTITITPSAYTAMTTTDAEVAKNEASTHKDGDELEITFGVSASASQAADTYSDVITLTAVANS